jgi:hypothetical protein
MKLKTIIIALLLSLNTGCSTLNYIQTSDVKTAVRIATFLYVDDDPKKAADVLYVIDKTREDIELYKEISISKAIEYVKANVLWEELKPIEAIAAEAIIDRIGVAIDNEIKHAQIPPDKIVLVHNVLDWIEESIILSQLLIEPVEVPEAPESTTTITNDVRANK